VKVELVGIDTRGDKILDVPLRAVEGKEFFVAEIDDALREKRVDFTVHSLKDLSLDRPKEFVLGAVPKRENPRDVILFNSLVTTRLKAGETIRIGTSAPRRLENIPAFLEGALPRFDSDSAPKLKFEEIRGNVNTRLARIHEPVSSERYLDGVVLAFAGIIRLWRDEEGRAELKRLLTGVRWMVLPLAECPAAPGQGALAVECRADDAETRTILSKIHDSGSEKLIRRERGLLAEWGGGCHQRFGAIAIGHEKLGELFFVRGSRAEGTFVEHLEWRSPPGPKSPVHFEPGREAAAKISALPAPAAVSQHS
jgi:hydroxymethylbilane synthase